MSFKNKVCIAILLINSLTLFPENMVTFKNYNFADRMDFFNVPGISLGVVENGELSYENAFGLVNQEAVFQAGEISKVVTAMGIMKLVQDGIVDLDTDVNLYLKDWKLEKDIYMKRVKVTLRHLLSHTSGIHSSGLRGYDPNGKLPGLVDILNGRGNISKVSVHYFPGLKFRYSWGGYIVIQKVIEDVTGMPFHDYIDENILKPLGMTSSTFEQNLSEDIKKKVAPGYDLFGAPIEGGWKSYPELGASGLWSTPSDILKLCIEIQRVLTEDYEGVLTRDLVEAMMVNHKKGWGLGFQVKFEGEQTTISHFGKSAGYTCYFIARPYEKQAIAIMTNGDNAWKLILEVLHSIPDYKAWGI